MTDQINSRPAVRPWHGIARDIAPGTSDPAAIAKAAGLDWRVNLSSVNYTFKDPNTGRKRQRALREKVLYREDTGDKLSICGPNYRPFQNDQVIGFFQEWLAAGDMSIDTAGSFKNGQVVWVAAKMNRRFTVGVGQDDVNESYVLMYNPHEYGKSASAKYTNMSIVCGNLIMAALHGAGDGIKLWHITEDGFTPDLQAEAKERLGIATERFEALEENANLLAQLEITQEIAKETIVRYFKGDVEQLSRPGQKVLDFFNGEGKGSTLPSRAGSGWGLLNAVTEYTDHHYGKRQDIRVQRSMMGTGDVIKRRVLADLMALTPTA